MTPEDIKAIYAAQDALGEAQAALVSGYVSQLDDAKAALDEALADVKDRIAAARFRTMELKQQAHEDLKVNLQRSVAANA